MLAAAAGCAFERDKKKCKRGEKLNLHGKKLSFSSDEWISA
jgi:hypothetical protein